MSPSPAYGGRAVFLISSGWGSDEREAHKHQESQQANIPAEDFDSCEGVGTRLGLATS
jgi:hypothetical protein